MHDFGEFATCRKISRQAIGCVTFGACARSCGGSRMGAHARVGLPPGGREAGGGPGQGVGGSPGKAAL